LVVVDAKSKLEVVVAKSGRTSSQFRTAMMMMMMDYGEATNNNMNQ
jgi:hypothetical protein